MAQIPQFKSENEEAKFWATHNFMDYIDDTEEIEVEIAPSLVKTIKERREEIPSIKIKLDSDQLITLREIATSKRVDYLTLFQEWIIEGVQREKKELRI
ncbi:MAG: CopG family antitoxin [bacterium]|nr:CopG family antitoxin [bacterium]